MEELLQTIIDQLESLKRNTSGVNSAHDSGVNEGLDLAITWIESVLNDE